MPAMSWSLSVTRDCRGRAYWMLGLALAEFGKGRVGVESVVRPSPLGSAGGYNTDMGVKGIELSTVELVRKLNIGGLDPLPMGLGTSPGYNRW